MLPDVKHKALIEVNKGKLLGSTKWKAWRWEYKEKNINIKIFIEDKDKILKIINF